MVCEGRLEWRWVTAGEARSPLRRSAARRYRGRKPSFDRVQLDIILGLLAQDASPTAIAEAAGVSRQVVYRVEDDPAKAEAMLAEWGL